MSIPLDVLVFVTLLYLSASLTFRFRSRNRLTSSIALASTAILFASYYLLLRSSLLDHPPLSCVVGVLLFLTLALTPSLLAYDRRRALRMLKLISIGTVRRTVEYIFVFTVLILLFPLFILISIFVKLSTPGTILVRQPGLSRSGKPVMLYSFRTKVPWRYKYSIGRFFMSSEQDWRFTRFGRFLHKSSLHLLPRLFNVLNGDVHLFGVSPLNTQLLATDFSSELLRKEHELVVRMYDASEGETFFNIIDYCIPTGVINYADLYAYELKPFRRTVVKLLDMRPRLTLEAEYFLYKTLPSLRLSILLIGKLFIRLLTAIKVLRLEEV